MLSTLDSDSRTANDSELVPVEDLRLSRRGRASAEPLVDGQARVVKYLRFSVVDRCNLRCRYCMPAEGVTFAPRDALLSYEEIERLTRVFVRLGVESVRLTGGEPLLRKGLTGLVARLAAVPGVRDLALSTNATHLAPIAAELRAAGLNRINVSIDSLDRATFADVARKDVLGRVLKGLEAAREAGFSPIKLNAVVLRDKNDHELGDLVRFALDGGYVLRFIEYMPIGLDDYWSAESHVTITEMMTRLRTDFDVSEMGDFAEDAGLAGGGPARYATVRERSTGREVRVGFIAALSRNFCSTCNRVRITAQGTLQECLAFPGQLSLRDLMRGGATDDALESAIRSSLAAKGPGHLFESGAFTYQSMSVTGG